MNLSNDFLQSLIDELDDVNTVGFALGGSYARGEAGLYSDVDIAHFVKALPSDSVGPHRSIMRDDLLVCFSVKQVSQELANLRRPEMAIVTVPAFRDLHILLDRDGSVAQLKHAALQFDWASLQAAANRYASYMMMDFAEVAHKTMGALTAHNTQMVLVSTRSQASGLTRAMATQRGLLIKTEATYFPQVWQAIGEASAWTHYHRVAVGLDLVALENTSSLLVAGIAGLHLYRETATLLHDIITSEHREVVDTTIARIADFNLPELLWTIHFTQLPLPMHERWQLGGTPMNMRCMMLTLPTQKVILTHSITTMQFMMRLADWWAFSAWARMQWLAADSTMRLRWILAWVFSLSLSVKVMPRSCCQK